MSQQIQFRLLGTVEVAGSRGIRPIGGPRQRAVLVYLLLRSGTLVSSERLIDAVWNGAPPAAARASLHSYVSNLRRALGSERIEGRSGGYVVHAEGDEVDATRFRSLVARAAATSPGRPTARAALLGEALELWRGPALEDLADEPAFTAAAVELNELRATARDEWIAARLALGEYGAVIAAVEALLDADPLRERLWEHLMTALYLDGRQADALGAYRRARDVLRSRLGIEPSPRLQQVQAMVLAQDLSLESLYPPLRGYRLLERTHDGPATTRYRARQPSSAREVDIEVIGPPLANDPAFVRSFDADAQAVSALRHPHIVRLVDWWREPDAAYLVTARVAGTTLAEVLDTGSLDVAESTRIVSQLRSAIDAAHRRGVGHGALNSGTVLLDDGGVSVTGFAVGRATLHDPATRVSDGEAIAAIAAALRHDGGAPVRAPGADGRGPNPYKGLRMFREADAPDFFGRTAAVTRLVERLTPDTRLLAVVGPSGAGKSSVVRAGLVPALRRGALPGSDRWSIVAMIPGAAPFEDLAAALLSVAQQRENNLAARLAAGGAALGDVTRRLLTDDSELLLIIDQFEELFVAVPDDDRDAFVAALLAAVNDPDSRLRVVATLRADFFDRPLRYGALGQLLASHTEVIAPLTPAEVTQAVTAPAERAGVVVEPALVAQIVRDVADQPGALPLLQYVLTEMYERGGTTLTVGDYRAVDGLVGALARRADQVLADLPPPAADAARQALLRSVTLGEGSSDVRRRVRRAELLELARDAGAMNHALDAFGAARLLTFDRDPETREPTVEIAHEALLTQWWRLRGWIDAARDELVTERQLAAATHEWQAGDRDTSFLATGHRLDRFSELAAGTVAITVDERAYIDASDVERRRHEDAETARREEHERVQRRSLRRLRALLAVLSVAVLVATVLTAFVVQQRNTAQREARIASARELAAAALANLEVDPQRSLLLAISAVERTRRSDGTTIPPAEDALHRAVQASRLIATVEGARGPMAWSPSGDVIAIGSAADDQVIQVRDASTFDVVDDLVHDAGVTGVVFNDDGSRMATTADDGVVRLWDADTAEQVHEVAASSTGAVAPAFGPDGAS